MSRILLIEDSAEDTSKVKKALASSEGSAYLESFDFSVAGSLARGFDILKNEKIDVVLLDLGLPDTRDFDGLDRIKREYPFTPVVVLTKQREEMLVALEAVKRGAQDYFSKSNLSDSCALDRIIRYAIERKKHEQEIIMARKKADRASEEALRASKAKSEFLSNMSHDIRTPLNCIIGVADLLSRAKLSEDEANYVQMLNKASDNLLSLINDILDLSKIESGLIKINKVDFDLLETVESVLDLVSTRAHAKGLEVIFRVEPNVPRRLVGDPEHLSQILVNLLANAIKFTKVGEITLDLAVGSPENGDAAVRFSVTDTGAGIPSDKLSLIFESFTQLDQSDVSLKRQGSGLGLSICKRLIDMLEGKVHVRSEVNKGSVFQFEIPFELPPKSSSLSIIPPLDLKGVEILVTEDNEAHGFFLKNLLQYWGAIVHVARNSQEAVGLVKVMRESRRKFHIALLDLRMPGVATGGLELSQKIKNDAEFVIMMLPTNHRYGDLESLKKAGINRYYFKPTKPERLAEIISEILYRDLGGKTSPTLIDGAVLKGKSLNLLVADDSEENRQLIHAYCKDSGFTLELAADGKQAFEKFKRQNFNLVLMDIQMPTMNGYEALSAIRAWEKSQKRPRVPVLALTAFALKEEEQRCLTAGFRAHVTKPIRKNDLIETIKKYAV